MWKITSDFGEIQRFIVSCDNVSKPTYTSDVGIPDSSKTHLTSADDTKRRAQEVVWEEVVTTILKIILLTNLSGCTILDLYQ